MSYTLVETIFDEAKFITSTTHYDYHFVGATFCIEINGESITLQSGCYFHNNDYSLPSNEIGIEDASELLMTIFNDYFEDDLLNSDVVNDINEECETEYSSKELIAMREAICEAICACHYVVAEKVREADKAFEEDKHHYILVADRDYDEYRNKYVQCSPDYSMRFDSEEEAEEAITSETEKHGLASAIDKATGISNQVEGYSNF